VSGGISATTSVPFCAPTTPAPPSARANSASDDWKLAIRSRNASS